MSSSDELFIWIYNPWGGDDGRLAETEFRNGACAFWDANDDGLLARDEYDAWQGWF